MDTKINPPPDVDTLARNTTRNRAVGLTTEEVDIALVRHMVHWISIADDAQRLELANRIARSLMRLPPCEGANALRALMILTHYNGDVTSAHKASCNVDGACPTCQGTTGPASNHNHICCTRSRDFDEFQIVYSP